MNEQPDDPATATDLLDVVGTVAGIHSRGPKEAQRFLVEIEIPHGPGWRRGRRIRLIDIGSDVTFLTATLDTPAGDSDYRRGPLDVEELHRIDNKALLTLVAEAADAHEQAREAQQAAGREHADTLRQTDQTRRAARQLAAELNRRLAQ